jgi:hypothetical protein
MDWSCLCPWPVLPTGPAPFVAFGQAKSHHREVGAKSDGGSERGQAAASVAQKSADVEAAGTPFDRAVLVTDVLKHLLPGGRVGKARGGSGDVRFEGS